MQIDRQTWLVYAEYFPQQAEQGAIDIATVENRLSSVARTIAALRGDQHLNVPILSNMLEVRRTIVCTVHLKTKTADT